MKPMFVTFGVYILLVIASTELIKPDGPGWPQREFRAVWIATVANIDWPGSRNDSSHKQQQDLIVFLDKLHHLRFNAVIFQMLEFFKKILEFFWKVEQVEQKEPGVDILAISVVFLLAAITILQCIVTITFYFQYRLKLKKFARVLENDVIDERRVQPAAVHETSVGIANNNATVSHWASTSTRDRESKIPRLRSLLQAHNTSWPTPSSSCTVTGRNPFMSDQTIYY